MVLKRYSLIIAASASFIGACASTGPSPEDLAAVARDKAPFKTVLTKYSCWTGPWRGGIASGRSTVCFVMTPSGELTALMKDSTGSPYNLDGPVSGLVIDTEKRTVKFNNGVGFPYQMEFKDGALSGTARGTVSYVTFDFYPHLDTTAKK